MIALRLSIALLAVSALLCGCAGLSHQSPASPGTQTSSYVPQSAQASTSGNTVTVELRKVGPPVSPDLYGAAQVTWTTITNPGTAALFHSMGLKLIRWPGGSESDIYHWANGGSLCKNLGGYIASGSTFDNFMNDDVIPQNLDVAITLNYGTNPPCTAGGSPSEAAAWVAYAKSKNYHVKYWTVGNEVYGNWEEDLHAKPHDPATYSAAVKNGYYPGIKAKDATARVGVVLSGSYAPSWDSYVLKNAKYDFVELHFYAQAPGNESDSWLLTQGPQNFTWEVQYVKNELATAGLASTPIYAGEVNSVYTNPGKQTVSIVNGLFAGMVLGEAMNQGLSAMTWWDAFGGCSQGNNNSSSLYGWQDFGTYNLFSDGIPTPYECPTISESIPFGTPFPPARAYQVFSQFAPAGARPAATSVGSSLPLVRAYAVKTAAGYGVLLFNLDQSNNAAVTVALNGASKTSFNATTVTYGRAQYDLSQSGTWAGPSTASLGTITVPYAMSLPPYSMTLLQLQ